jgi:hypothetical protein
MQVPESDWQVMAAQTPDWQLLPGSQSVSSEQPEPAARACREVLGVELQAAKASAQKPRSKKRMGKPSERPYL